MLLPAMGAVQSAFSPRWSGRGATDVPENAPSPLSPRDLVVNGSDPNPANRTVTIDCQGKEYPMRGNVSVIEGGSLTIDSCIFRFEQDTSHHFWFTVQGKRPSDNASSRLTVRSSTITVDPYIIQAYLPLPMKVLDGATAYFEKSGLVFPGELTVASSTAVFNDSVVNGIKGASDPNGPSILFQDSYVVASGSQFRQIPESTGVIPSRAVPLVKGSNDTSTSDLGALADQDFIYYFVDPGIVMEIDGFDVSSLKEPLISAELHIIYHTEEDGFANYNGTRSFMYAVQGGSYSSTGITPTAADTSDVHRTFDLFANGVDTLAEISDLNVYFQHDGPNGTLLIDALWVEVASKSDQEVSLWGSTTFLAIDTFLDLDFRSASDVGLHNYMNISGTSRFYGIGISVDEKESGGTPQDPAIITSTPSAEGYIFRWMNISVRDGVGASVAGANLSRVPNYQDPWKTFVESFNDLCSSSNLNVYGQLTLDYISRTFRPVGCSNYTLTFSDGTAFIPAFSDHITGDQLPNAWHGGKYNLTTTFKSNTCTSYVNLSRYPSLGTASNYHPVQVQCTFAGDHSDVYPDTVGYPAQAPLGRPVSIQPVIYNVGNAPAQNFDALVYDDLDFDQNFTEGVDDVVQWWSNLTLAPGSNVPLSTVWTPMIRPAQVHSLVTDLDPNGTLTNEPLPLQGNNTAANSIMVTNYPDLMPLTLVVPVRAMVGSQITISSDITNGGGSPSGQFAVEIRRDSPTNGTIVHRTNITNIDPGKVVPVSTTYQPTTAGTIKFYMVVDVDDDVEEISDANNLASATVDVYDPPDLNILDLNYTSPVLETRSFVTLMAKVKNTGVWNVSGVVVNFYAQKGNGSGQVFLGNHTIDDMGPNAVVTASFNWTLVDGDEGNYTVLAWVNENDTATPKEGDKNNNQANLTIHVGRMAVRLEINQASSWRQGKTFEPGAGFIIIATVTRLSTGGPVTGVNVTATIKDTSRQATKTTDSAGSVNLIMNAPTDTSHGCYILEVRVQGFTNSEAMFTNGKVCLETPAETPLWVWALIIIIVAVVVIFGVLFALGRAARGKMVECGECGALISESHTSCPKCHAVFEADVVKCSSCLGWIPATATECPKCGVVFTARAKKGETYEAIMKKQYEEWVESKRKTYRAKVGARFTEQKFQQWFRKQPDYMSLQEWISEQEKARKGRTCPQCRTENPRDAAVCQRCGMDLTAVETAAPEEEVGPPKPSRAEPSRRPADGPEERKKPVPAGKLSPKEMAGTSSGKRRVVKGAPEASEIKKRCPTCSAMNAIDRELCVDCGERLPPPTTCEACSTQIPSDAKFCPVCGKPQ